MPSSAVGIIERTFLPNQLPGLAAWFRFGRGIVESGGAVSQWNDQSGHGRHLVQATGTNQPALQSDGSILFDGVDNYLKCAAFTLNQPETIYLLFKQPTWTLLDRFTDGNALNTGSINQSNVGAGVSPTISVYGGAWVGPIASIALDSYAALSCVLSGTSSLLQHGNNAPVTGDGGAANMGGFTLGARADATAFANVQVKEAIVYSVAHPTQIRTQMARYLARVGGLTI